MKGKLIKIENIFEPPFKFLWIEGDKTCNPETNKPYAYKVPAFYSETTITGRDHAYVVVDNDDEFFGILMNSLTHFNEPLSYADCKKLNP